MFFNHCGSRRHRDDILHYLFLQRRFAVDFVSTMIKQYNNRAESELQERPYLNLINNTAIVACQVKVWRRSFDTPPPSMHADHPYYDRIVNDSRYADGPCVGRNFPMFESLKLTIERTLPYWDHVIVPQMRLGKRVVIVAHGNSLRGIVKYLDSECIQICRNAVRTEYFYLNGTPLSRTVLGLDKYFFYLDKNKDSTTKNYLDEDKR
jgi:bisphosphoglycerate-dependent phosphoglycerate mutase